MEESKCILRKICCACLSVDRRLTQLCRLQDGVNNLFFLLSSDSEAYAAMFRLDATSLFVCWECLALMRRQGSFRDQVCAAQKHLTLIADGQAELKPQDCLSKLSKIHQNSFSKEFVYDSEIIDNFVDCAKDSNIIDEVETNLPLHGADSVLDSFSDEESKTENINEIKISKNTIEIKPLSLSERKRKGEITNKRVSLKRKVKTNKESKIKEEEGYFNEIKVLVDHIEVKGLSSKNRIKRKEVIDEDIKVLDNKVKIEPCSKTELKNSEELVAEDGFSKIRMSEEELLESIEKRKLESNFVDALNKCDSCVEVFKSQIELEQHNASWHVQKPKFIQCDICQVYVKFWCLPEHKNEHYLKYQCDFCARLYYNVLGILIHLKEVHSIKNTLTGGLLKKLKRKAMLTNPVLTRKRNYVTGTEGMSNGGESTFDFECPQCGQSFESRYLRYKHILKLHREGHKCPTCGKTFAFKNTLNKHEQVHGAPLPTQPCPVCGKMVRLERVAAHARIHSDRTTYDCVACDKRFVSRDSYEKHLKYSKTHAVTDVHKYKCTMCEKGFRTARELSDHVDYKHMGRTQHQCPICHKALATRRCVTRHVNRAHRGLKEKSGDKILCHACGRAFHDKKSLREHQLIHTGEKPLSCDVCGRAFRQSACLYTHKRRVHKMAPARLSVRHAPPAVAASTG